tara:strand:+ start:96 stop:272 length:177 start_codon:yes stop_codon:yes gene_type:complete
MKCDICKGEISPVGEQPGQWVFGWLEGHNAEPVVNNGRCCDHCNVSVVIPARLRSLEE